MYSIGEFSRICGLSVKTLRFYHEKELLVPAAVDDSSGYRYYNPANLERARIIVALRGLGFTLSEIQTVVEEADDEADILEYLSSHKSKLQSEIRHRRNLISTLDQIIQREEEARTMMQDTSFSIERESVAPMLVAGIRMTGKYSDCGQGFSKLGKAVGRYISGKPFCLHYDGEYREHDANFEACFPIKKAVEVEGVSVRELPGMECVSLMHRGPYDELGRSYERLLEHLKENSMSFELPTREIYIKGPGMIFRGNPRKYLTQIQLPVTSK